jgi:hypothetical protein
MNTNTAIDPADWAATYPMIGELWRELLNRFFDRYRPERHYMRGPGPKWRERHEASGLTGRPRHLRRRS